MVAVQDVVAELVDYREALAPLRCDRALVEDQRQH